LLGSRYLASLDPTAPASLAVRRAGETRSANWFDIARESTERWHHQQQIPLAVGKPALLTPRFYAPGISPEDARSQITIEGDERLGAVILRALAIAG
jgi:hypothetical protein